MELWLFDSDAPEADIRAGCRAAQAWDDAEDEALRVCYHGEEPPDEPVLGPA
jgi:hypothetical protein